MIGLTHDGRGYCDCGKPSMCGATGWCGYCEVGRSKAATPPPIKTLRDEYAMAALAGFLARGRLATRDTVLDALKVADTMLEARKEREG